MIFFALYVVGVVLGLLFYGAVAEEFDQDDGAAAVIVLLWPVTLPVGAVAAFLLYIISLGRWLARMARL